MTRLQYAPPEWDRWEWRSGDEFDVTAALNDVRRRLHMTSSGFVIDAARRGGDVETLSPVGVTLAPQARHGLVSGLVRVERILDVHPLVEWHTFRPRFSRRFVCQKFTGVGFRLAGGRAAQFGWVGAPASVKSVLFMTDLAARAADLLGVPVAPVRSGGFHAI